MSSEKYRLTKHVFPGQHIRRYAGGTRDRQEDVQYLEAKQYTPRDNGKPQHGDVTIIGTCAISFPKEMYEPYYDDLLSHFESHGLRIRSIWLVDKSDHGASGILNEHTQGDDPSTSDLARDLLNMVNLFREQMTLPVVGIGHSLGGTALLELSLIHPRLFAALVLTDPVVGPSMFRAGHTLVYASSIRSDLWSSRQEAEKFFRSAKPLRKWDSRVMELWLQYGLRDTPTLLYSKPGEFTLRTTKANEAWNYARSWFEPLPRDDTYLSERSRIKYPDGDGSILKTHPFYRGESMIIWDSLPRIQPSVLYVFPDSGSMSTAEAMADKVTRTGSGVGGSGGEKFGKTTKVVIRNSSHLVPFEEPEQCAKVSAAWLAKELKAWQARTEFEAKNRDDKSVNKAALSDEWVQQAKLWYGKHMGKPKARL